MIQYCEQNVFFVVDLLEMLFVEYMNEMLKVDDEGYYNIVEFNMVIQVEDLQCVVFEKSVGENNIFQFEYKVLILLYLNILFYFY